MTRNDPTRKRCLPFHLRDSNGRPPKFPTGMYTEEETEFLKAVDAKRSGLGRMLRVTEYLHVLVNLGYRKKL